MLRRAGRPLLQAQKLFDDRLVSAEADGVAEETCDGAELAAVGAAAPRLYRYKVGVAPAFPDALHQRAKERGHDVELFERERVPGDFGVGLQARLAAEAPAGELRLCGLL